VSEFSVTIVVFLVLSESTLVIDHINNISMLFAQLSMANLTVENEYAWTLLQSLSYLYDQLIINIIDRHWECCWNYYWRI